MRSVTLNSMEQSPSWETNRSSASQEIFRILWNRNVHYRFTRAGHLSLSWTKSFRPMPPYPTSWRSNFISSSYLRLDLPSGLFPSGLPTKILFASLLSPIVPSSPPISFFLDLVTRIMFGVYRSRSSSLCSLFQIPLTSTILGPHIILSPLFSKHPQPMFFPQCERPSFTPIQNNSHSYNSVTLIFIILDSKVADKRFCPEWWQAFPWLPSVLNFFMNGVLIH